MSAATVEDDLPALLALMLDEPEDELASMLWHAHVMLMKHPIAARAAFRSLVAEGRRYARESEEGAAWKARLKDSDIVRRGRSVWELATLGMLTETPGMLPTQLIDMLAYTAGLASLEPTLARAVEPRPSTSLSPALLSNATNDARALDAAHVGREEEEAR